MILVSFKNVIKNWLVGFLCFNNISTFIGYLMPKQSSYEDSSGTI